MNLGNLLSLIMQLAIPTVLTIEQVHSQAVSGADKKTMAMTALQGATDTALQALPAGSQESIWAKAASTFASAAIDVAVAFTKKTGQYQAASSAAASTTSSQPATA